jgi:hypothetical protein
VCCSVFPQERSLLGRDNKAINESMIRGSGRRPRSDTQVPPRQHAFSHAPAALRIFRFAADSAPRVLEIAHISAFLRECAVEFGSADATLPGAMRIEYAAKRYYELRDDVVQRNAARCPWLAEKILACRSVAPIPAAALAPDVTRHDVNWGAEGVRLQSLIAVSDDGATFLLNELAEATPDAYVWAQSAVRVSRGKHWFAVCVKWSAYGSVKIGWLDDATSRVSDSCRRPGPRLRADDRHQAGGRHRRRGARRGPRRLRCAGTHSRRAPRAQCRACNAPAPWAACWTSTRAR